MKSYKFVFTVPEAQAESVRNALSEAGAGIMGNYTHCSFSSHGIGRFLPMDGANPAIGTVGKPEEVSEERVEMVVSEEDVRAVVAKLEETHPYEEVAYDVFERLDF